MTARKVKQLDLHLSTRIEVQTREVTFSLVRDGEQQYSAAAITSPSEASAVAQGLIADRMAESVMALFLDARHRLIGYAELVRGTLNAARLQPRDVLVPALHANAAAIVLAHNHPSGDTAPSRADHVVTSTLRTLCTTVGIPLLDHLIVAQGARPYSFRETEQWDVVVDGRL